MGNFKTFIKLSGGCFICCVLCALALFGLCEQKKMNYQIF